MRAAVANSKTIRMDTIPRAAIQWHNDRVTFCGRKVDENRHSGLLPI